MIADTNKIPPSGKHRSSSSNKKVKVTAGKKKKQMRENIRAAQELNASGGYFHKVPSHNIRQVYKNVPTGTNGTGNGIVGGDIYIQHGFKEQYNMAHGQFSIQKAPTTKFASDHVLQEQIVSKTLNHVSDNG